MWRLIVEGLRVVDVSGRARREKFDSVTPIALWGRVEPEQPIVGKNLEFSHGPGLDVRTKRLTIRDAPYGALITANRRNSWGWGRRRLLDVVSCNGKVVRPIDLEYVLRSLQFSKHCIARACGELTYVSMSGGATC